MFFKLDFHAIESLKLQFPRAEIVWPLKQVTHTYTIRQTDIYRQIKPTHLLLVFIHAVTPLTTLHDPTKKYLPPYTMDSQMKPLRRQFFSPWNRDHRLWNHFPYKRETWRAEGIVMCWNPAMPSSESIEANVNYSTRLAEQRTAPLVKHYNNSGQTFIVIFPDGGGCGFL